MALDALIRGWLRGGDIERRVEVHKRGSLYVVDDLPSSAELVRQGAVWGNGQTAATAAVIAIPTTACQLALYNDEPEGSGKSYVILRIMGWQAANGAAQASWGIVHGISQIKPTTKPTADLAASTYRPLRANQGAYGGKAIMDLAPTLDVDPLYKPLGGSVGTVVVSLSGTQVDHDIKGGIILPPGGLLALHVVATAVGITTTLYALWAELQLDIP